MSRSKNNGKSRKFCGFELWAPRPGQFCERTSPEHRRLERRTSKKQSNKSGKFKYDWFNDE